MEHIWNIYGKYMENMWKINGKYMENIWKYIWKIYGQYVENIWKIHGKYMENMWKIYGKYMENMWKIYGKYMENIWKIYGKYVENIWIYGKYVENIWLWINTYYCNTIFRGMNIHKSQLFWCELQGYKVLTHCHMENIWKHVEKPGFNGLDSRNILITNPGFTSQISFFLIRQHQNPLV